MKRLIAGLLLSALALSSAVAQSVPNSAVFVGPPPPYVLLTQANTWIGVQTFTTPVLDAATGTSLALSGCSLGADKLCVNGTATVNSGATDQVLALNGTGSPYFSLSISGVRKAFFQASPGTNLFYSDTGQIVDFYTNATFAARLTSAQHFLVAGTSDLATLTVTGTIGTAGTIPTVTGTGTPTIASGSTDTAGEVTSGTSATSVVITFSSAKSTAPFCTVTPQTQLAAFAYTISTSAITITQTATTGEKIDYNCFQH